MTGGIHQGLFFSPPKSSVNVVFLKPEERLFVFAATMSSGQESVFPEYETDTSQTSKLLRKFKETPFVPIGKFKDEEMWLHGSFSSWAINMVNTVTVHLFPVNRKLLPPVGFLCGDSSIPSAWNGISSARNREINEACYLKQKPRTYN